jgi:hypothetical protein
MNFIIRLHQSVVRTRTKAAALQRSHEIGSNFSDVYRPKRNGVVMLQLMPEGNTYLHHSQRSNELNTSDFIKYKMYHRSQRELLLI